MQGFYTVREAVDLLGLSYNAIEHRVRDGKIKSIKTRAGRRLIPLSVISELNGEEKTAEEFLTVKEVSAIMSVSDDAVRRRIKDGKLRSRDIDGLIHVPVGDVIAWQTGIPQDGTSTTDQADRFLFGNASPYEKVERELKFFKKELRKSNNVIERFQDNALREQNVIDNIVNAVRSSPLPKVQPGKPNEVNGEPHEMCLLISDAHYGEFVDPEAMFGILYTPKVALESLVHVTEKTIAQKLMYEGRLNVNKLTIAVLGDMLSGEFIHEEIDKSNYMPVTEQWVQISNALAVVIEQLAGYFVEVDVVVMPGNHCRISKNPYFKNKWNNFEYMMGIYLEALLSNQSNVTVIVPKDLVYTHKILGLSVAMTHGDMVKSGSGTDGVPLASLGKKRVNFQQAMKELGIEQADIFMMGHLHNPLWIPGRGCDMILNGAIKPSDEYIWDASFTITRPSQTLLTINGDERIVDYKLINLDHIGRRF